MRDLRTLSIKELQNYGMSGDEEALLELGKRVLNTSIHEHDREFYCRYKFELEDLQTALDIQIPLECPHCGGWLTDM